MPRVNIGGEPVDEYSVEITQDSHEDDMTQLLSEEPSGTIRPSERTLAGHCAEEFCHALGEKIPALQGERERGIVEGWFAERLAAGRWVDETLRKASRP